MNFEQTFQKLLERLDHSLAMMLMGVDGISVVSQAKPGVTLELELMGAEISAVLSQLRHLSFVSQFGETNEFVFRSDKTTILLTMVTHDYFVALVMSPECHVGKGRHLLRMLQPELLTELS